MIDVKTAVIPASQITGPAAMTNMAKILSKFVITGMEPYPIVVTRKD